MNVIRCKTLFDAAKMTSADVYDYLETVIPGILVVDRAADAQFKTGSLGGVMTVYDYIDPEIRGYVKDTLVDRHLKEMETIGPNDFETNVAVRLYVLARLQYIAVKVYNQQHGFDAKLAINACVTAHTELQVVTTIDPPGSSFAHIQTQARTLYAMWEALADDNIVETRSNTCCTLV